MADAERLRRSISNGVGVRVPLVVPMKHPITINRLGKTAVYKTKLSRRSIVERAKDMLRTSPHLIYF